MDCALIASGIGYVPKTDKTEETYFSIQSINILGCDLSLDMPSLMSNWNCCVHNWLKYYVMLRWIDRKKDRRVVQPFPIFMSFFMSLVWHGIWSGYVIVFMGAAYLDVFYKQLLRTKLVCTIQESVPRFVYLLVWFPFHRFMFSWVTISFHFQFFDRYNKIYSSMHYLGFWIMLALPIAANLLPIKRSEKPKDGTESKGPNDNKVKNE
jgi:D-alanyl-lipoteichoic acid acyltransferase DltB (MBOAT superfamily)